MARPLSVLSDRIETTIFTAANAQTNIPSSSLELMQSPFNRTLEDDSGYQSDDERQIIQPSTPKRLPMSISTDSGISMGDYSPSEGITIRSVRLDDSPASPLAAKSAREKRNPAVTKLAPPALTPVQPQSSPPATTSDSVSMTLGGRKFMPYHKPDPSQILEKMQKYIKKPLGSKAKKEGHIYGFQVPDCKLIKMGYSGALPDRLKALARCGYPPSGPAVQERVFYAQRIEQIIFHHLYKERMKEYDMEQGSNGRKCKHKTHKELLEVEPERLTMIVQAWKRWSECQPYVEINGEFHLSPEWERNLEQVRLESDDDHWMKWLDHYVPDKSAKSVINPMSVASNYADSGIEVKKEDFLQQLS